MKYYILSGEASGDLHGSNLMRSILQMDAQADIRFWGGDLMQQVGGTMVRHIRDLAYMGFVEVVSHLGVVLGNMRLCKRDIRQFSPDVLVTIDYPGFNLRMAKYAHQLGIATVHYISPQLWAWKKGRIRSMRRCLDHLCYILPFEREFFAHNGFPGALYVGHPLLDAVGHFQQSAAPSADERPLVALLPGSRRQELRKVLPTMLSVAERHPEFRFRIAGMRLIGEEFYHQLAPQGWPANVEVRMDGTYELLSQSNAALVCSGTATLEATLFRVPQVVCYRSSALSMAIARRLVGRRIRFISLPNLVADREVVRELIQNDCSVEQVEQELMRLMEPDHRQQLLADYDDIIKSLGGVGASDRVAAVALQAARDNQNNNTQHRQ